MLSHESLFSTINYFSNKNKLHALDEAYVAWVPLKHLTLTKYTTDIKK